MAGRVQAELGSRVALRTFVAFGLASVLPVALFALIGFLFVGSELQETAQRRLEEAAKRYGIALNERLIQSERLMIEAGRIALESDQERDAELGLLHRLQILSPLSGDESPIVERPVGDSEARLPEGWWATRALQAEVAAGVPSVRLIVTVGDGARQVRLVADPSDRQFWNSDVALPDARVCVFVRERPLHCESGELDEAAGEMNAAEWTLFHKPRYGAEGWSIRLEQPRSIALAALRSFNFMAPVTALLAIAAALLLSFRHIRRLHRPLHLLAAAARRMGRGQFRQPVEIVSDDEFASVGRALNRLGARLRRQFRLLSALGQIDRKILEHPTFAPVVATLLPRMPRLLRCRAAAVLVHAQDDAPAQLHLYDATRGSVESLALEAHDEATRLAALRRLCPDVDRWLPSPILVRGEQRGTVLAAATAGARPRERGALRRQLRSFAHRLAVALGNQDRERAMLKQAHVDPLTGLANRQLCRDRIEQELLRCRRDGHPLALLYIDLDHFKHVNDSLGHSAGDALLRAVAARLTGALREVDTLARLGADEFALLCPELSSAQAAAVAAKLHALLSEPVPLADQAYSVQASIGIAAFPDSAGNGDQLLRNANAAMYRAKQAGRARSAFFEEGMNREAERRLVVAQRLRLALESGGLRLAYQPKVGAADGALHGFEALARWSDAELGNVSPAEFIAVAEETGQVQALGRFALRESCRRMAEWRRDGLAPTSIAVNVSVHQLDDAQFTTRVRDCLVEFGLEPAALQLEITESKLATGSPVIVAALAELRAVGVTIAMDDFGTGYSSLASLRELPVDVLKIDRSFVVRCCDSREDEALLRGVIELAHTLGKTVVAEGVETQAQLGLLRELGCDIVQGYLTGRPLDVDAARGRLAACPRRRASPEPSSSSSWARPSSLRDAS